MRGKTFVGTVIVPLAIFFGGSAITVTAASHVPHNPHSPDSNIGDSEGFGTRTLYPCATEDSDNCYWDARTMGNGPERIAQGLNPGISFVTLNGTTYYLK